MTEAQARREQELDSRYEPQAEWRCKAAGELRREVDAETRHESLSER